MLLNLLPSIIINGLAVGMVYAMTAMGLVLLIRAVGVLNFSQGMLIMLGAYVASWVISDMGLPLWVSWLIMIAIYLIIGFIFMICTYWPLRKASYPVAPVIATIGMSFVIRELVPIIFGSWPRTLPNLFVDADLNPIMINIFGAKIQFQYIAIIVVAGLSMFLVHLIFNKMYFGRTMQAAAQNKYAAELIGISTLFTTAMTYMLVVLLISIGSYTVAPIFMVSSSLQNIQMRAMAGTIIGGYGNIKGSIIGCLIVGIVEAFASIYASMYKDACIYLVLLIFLVFRPQGIFKSTVEDKA